MRDKKSIADTIRNKFLAWELSGSRTLGNFSHFRQHPRTCAGAERLKDTPNTRFDSLS